jgi:hypothetical protein
MGTVGRKLLGIITCVLYARDGTHWMESGVGAESLRILWQRKWISQQDSVHVLCTDMPVASDTELSTEFGYRRWQSDGMTGYR